MVHNVEELKTLIDDYGEIVDKAGTIADGWHFTPTSVTYDGDWLFVSGYEYCRGYTDSADYSFPISWMFMDPEQLAKAKEEKEEADKIAKQEWERQKAEREAAEAEAKDRAEYERLRTKYGNELPVGTIFRVENGCWKGQIVEGEDGKKYIHVLDNPEISDFPYNAERFSENSITILRHLTKQ